VVRTVDGLPPVSQAAAPSWDRGGFAAVAAVVLVAWFVGLLASIVSPVLAGLVGIVAGLLFGRFVTDEDRVWLAVAFLPAAALIGTGLVPLAGRYLPVLVVGTAIAAANVPELRRDPRALVPRNRLVSVAIVAYLVWFAIATLTSSDLSASLVYLAGAVGTLALLFFVLPTVLKSPNAMRALLMTFAGLGLGVVAAGLLIALVGSFDLNGLSIGHYAMFQLTVLGQQTTLVVPRITGPYLSPSNDAVALVIAILALLTMHERARTGRRGIVVLIAICSIGLVSTFDRNGLLALAAGTGVFAFVTFVNRRSLGLPALVSMLATLLLAAFLLNVVGATLRQVSGPEAAAAAATAATAATDDLQVRGGASLSGRDKLWRASVDAIAAKPLFGSGPGTNVEAIDPYLVDQTYAGLTSHDTWLRTAVELGVPGLIFLLAFVFGVLGSAWRHVRLGALDPSHLGLVSIFVALLFAFTFETFLLGGLIYGSVVLPLVGGLLARAGGRAITAPGLDRAPNGAQGTKTHLGLLDFYRGLASGA
jgi:O-Antigen ligase